MLQQGLSISFSLELKNEKWKLTDVFKKCVLNTFWGFSSGSEAWSVLDVLVFVTAAKWINILNLFLRQKSGKYCKGKKRMPLKKINQNHLFQGKSVVQHLCMKDLEESKINRAQYTADLEPMTSRLGGICFTDVLQLLFKVWVCNFRLKFKNAFIIFEAFPSKVWLQHRLFLIS